MFLKAPKGVPGCSVDGTEYTAQDGIVEVPDNVGHLLFDHGFVLTDNPMTEAEQKAAEEENAKVEAEKLAAEKAAKKAVEGEVARQAQIAVEQAEVSAKLAADKAEAERLAVDKAANQGKGTTPQKGA